MKNHFRILGLLFFAIVISLSGCSKKKDVPQQKTEKSEKTVRQINVYNWESYIAKDLLDAFTKKTGIRVNYKTYQSNEEMLAELGKMPTGSYDLIFPSDYMVELLIEKGMIDTLDLKKIVSYYKIDKKFRNPPFDPLNQYSIAYSWGTSGIAYRRDKLDEKTVENHWKMIFKNPPELNGKITFLKDMRETMGAALKYLGYSANSRNQKEIEMARDLLLDCKKKAAKFDSNPAGSLVNGDIWMAHMWSGDAVVSLYTDEISKSRMKYFVPSQGSIIFIDNMCIPKGAKHVAEAYEFINFVLLGENALKTVLAIKQPSTSSEVYTLIAANPQLASKYLIDAIYPPAEVVENCEYLEDVGDAITYYNQAWEQIIK